MRRKQGSPTIEVDCSKKEKAECCCTTFQEKRTVAATVGETTLFVTLIVQTACGILLLPLALLLQMLLQRWKEKDITETTAAAGEAGNR